jgi:imidazolonepropionase-like amidohydrolase
MIRRLHVAQFLAFGTFVAVPVGSVAQRPALGNGARQFVAADEARIALRNVRIIDGTGAPARDGQTVLIDDGRIAAVGPEGQVAIPEGTRTFDLTGKSVLPGLVMLHEHLYYPTGPGVYGNLAESFVRLYLAGGVTSMRTGGNMNGFGEINIKQAIDRGEKAGPWIDATAPYLQGAAGSFGQMKAVTVDAGFTPLEAIRIGTLNGATYLRRAESIGSIAVGKQADLVVVDGDPSQRIADVRNVNLVFKQGVAYDPAKLVASVKGWVGIW